MTHVSLFSGIGGAEIAATWMGWTNLFHVEINPFGRRVLEYWYPNSTSYEDITKTDFRLWLGRVDVLTAGFPCQPFSLAGSRRGADDDRYLWPQVVRALREIRPAWFVGENVAGILTMVQPGEEVEVGNQPSLFGEDDRKRVLLRQEYVVETICRDLEREGYAVQPFVIPACAVGAPHRRDRVWFVAHRADTGLETLQCGREDRVHAAGLAAHAKGTGGERECERRPWEEEPYGQSIEDDYELPALRWADFPTTKPAVRAGDDGLPARLAGITFPQWRQESIKALGNAWVPQVAYEIFRAIQQAENKKNNLTK